MKRIGWLGVLVLVAAASIGAACEGCVNVEDQGGGVSSSTGENQGGGVSSSTGENQGGGGASSSTGVATPCSAPIDCGPTEYCDSFYWTCDEGAHCNQRPVECTGSAKPVCACDGKLYEDECAAFAAGVGLAAKTICAVPAGTFQCGYTFCKIGAEFCREQFEISWSCAPFPAECQGENADCTCLGFGPQGEGGSSGQGNVPGCGACYENGEGVLLLCSPF